MAAPLTPIRSMNINIGSRIMFATSPTTTFKFNKPLDKI